MRALFGGVLIASAVVGVAWGLLAPAEQVVVVADGSGVALTGESLHRFDAVAMLACAGVAVGVVSAVAAWGLRRARGVRLVAVVFVASVLGAMLSASVGDLVGSLRHQGAGTAETGEMVSVAPSVETLLVLVFQPLAACLVLAVLALLNPRDDLGAVDEDPHAPLRPGDDVASGESSVRGA
nr:DUF2567 domain-containing protein [Rhodococcus sp. HNM0569]